MAELILISNRKKSLKPLVQAALDNELRILEAGIRRAEKRIVHFEEQFHMTTADFIRKYENDEIEENLELAEWIGEYRILERQREKVETLRGVKFAN